MLSYFVELELH